MLNKKVENALNEQINIEFTASHLYLAMASWADKEGMAGTAKFLYAHSDEEREHALRLYHYVNDRGGHAVTPALEAPQKNYESLDSVFKAILEHEQYVSEKINDLVGVCMQEKDFTTNQFLQWYVEEQVEEESLFSTLLGKLEMLEGHKGKTYLFDKELEAAAGSEVNE